MKKIFVALVLLTAGSTSLTARQLAAIETAPPVTEDGNAIVKGTIRTADGSPAAYVSVVLKGTSKFTTTDEDGNFQFTRINSGTYTLEISLVGLETIEESFSVQEKETLALNIQLKENSKQLESVIVEGRRNLNGRPVTIGKLPIAPLDLPQAITVIGQHTLKEQQSMRLSDVIKNVNGIYLGTARGSTQETFYGRGYSLGANNMFKNGARLNTGTMPEISGLDRVEILKGSAAILYGNVAPGGILNMVTKKPKFNFGGEVSMRAGSYDLYKPSIDVYGPLSKSVAYRINGTYEKANSFRDDVSSTRYYVNPSFLFKLSERTELILEGDYLYHKFTPDFGIGSIGDSNLAPAARNQFFGTPWQYAKSQQTTGTASIKHQLNDSWTINGTLSIQNYNRDYFSAERIQWSGKQETYGDWKRPLGRTYTEENYYLAQAFVNGKFKTGIFDHTLLAGIDADQIKTIGKAFQIEGGTTYDVINLFDASKYTRRTDMPNTWDTARTKAPVVRFGAYVQDLIQLGEKWNLLAGVRWSIQDAKGIDTMRYNMINKKDTAFSGRTRTNKAFSPRVGIVYKPIPTTAVFASYSNSFTINSGSDLDGNPVKPSIVDQFELGIKNDLFNNKLSINVTAYRIINHNLAQMAPFLKDGTANNNNLIKELTGETTSDGVELDITAHPVQGMNIIAGYSYNNMRYTKTDSAGSNFVEGQRLVNSPAHTANASLFYTFSGKALKGLKLGATAVYIGDRVAGWNNTFANQKAGINRRIPVNGYSTLDLTAGYTWKNISILAKVINLFNELNYIVHENYSVNPIAPRQLLATIAYRF
ncbi:TonB-dependent receptor [Pseudoflavitalea rhizosphaerae]|uniref:TonB-dependent receptor n=1 Tax=Pseudoflavitalea rhizosphaerae TaxID=1884793 RepID=UPI000F8D1968|nr:TonB-dependent receptor [Pseudoflavitalea rhizosphaerae]